MLALFCGIQQSSAGSLLDDVLEQKHQKENKITDDKTDEDKKREERTWSRRYVYQHSMTFCVTWLNVKPVSSCFERPEVGKKMARRRNWDGPY